jgi:hypothetical protein
MSGASRSFVRLLAVAIALAIAGGTGASGSAPQALRVWIDSAAEIATARPSALAGHRGQSPRPSVAGQGFPPPSACLPPRLVTPTVARLAPSGARDGTPTWATAHDRRGLLALKRARLI